MKVKNFDPFIGQHCETTATGSLLKHLGIHLSEPMLFGLGEGLSFLIWNMKIMDFPFIGGRVKPDTLTEHLCNNLNLQLDTKETSSLKKAWKNIEEPLSKGIPVGLKLDCYHLEYFTNKIHFAGHYVAMYDYDDQYAHLIDTKQQGGQVKTLLTNLELARNERGSMSSRNKSFTISKNEKQPDIKDAIRQALFNNAQSYLNPPIKNVSYKGIKKTASEIKKWFHSSENIEYEFDLSATLMERAGTGGSLFRNLYRDFLKESAGLVEDAVINEVYNDFIPIAKAWKQVSDLFILVSKTKDEAYIDQASDVLLTISESEKNAMEKLYNHFYKH